MPNKVGKLAVKRKDGYIVGKLKELAKEIGFSLGEIAKEAEIPRSSIYYFDEKPWELTLSRLDKIRVLEGKDWGEFGLTTLKEIIELRDKTKKVKK